jgi:hypothetical protein
MTNITDEENKGLIYERFHAAEERGDIVRA